jgi:hypothetical protein
MSLSLCLSPPRHFGLVQTRTHSKEEDCSAIVRQMEGLAAQKALAQPAGRSETCCILSGEK